VSAKGQCTGGSEQVAVYRCQPSVSVQVAVSSKWQCIGGSGSVSQEAVYMWQWQSQPKGSVQVAVAVSAKWQCTGGSVQVAESAKG